MEQLIKDLQKEVKNLKEEIKTLKKPKKTIEQKMREKQRVMELLAEEEYAKGCPKCGIVGSHCCFYDTPKPGQGNSIYY